MANAWIPVSHGHHPLVARRARELRRVMTPAEHALWARLRNRQLMSLRFRRQHAIDGFIADFFCHSMRLVVEVDGPVHDATRERDLERDEHLQRQGYRVLRFTNAQVLKNTESVVEAIRKFLLETDVRPLGESE